VSRLHVRQFVELDVFFFSVCRQKDKERKSRLSLFLTKSGSHENVSPHKKDKYDTQQHLNRGSFAMESDSFEELLKHSDGVEIFSQFLRTEFSEENIEFWLACEEYSTIDSETKLRSKAKYIYTVFIESDAPKEVNIDYNTKMAIQKNIAQPTKSCFEAAQMKVYSLMKKDSYPPVSSNLTFICVHQEERPWGHHVSQKVTLLCVSTREARPRLDSAW
ncbi:Regulator of G-protein signaling 18, partial [Nibea albiflora]